MADLYIQLTYDEWKLLEKQCKAFKETTHGKGSEYYHKSFRISVGGTAWEFHAPVVKARQILGEGDRDLPESPPVPPSSQSPSVPVNRRRRAK